MARRKRQAPRHCSVCGRTGHDRRAHRGARRNPPTRAASARRGGRVLRVNPDDLRTAYAKSETFHGSGRDYAVTLDKRDHLPDKHAIVIGPVENFTYRTPGGSKRNFADWIHASGDRGDGRPKGKRKPLLVAGAKTGRVEMITTGTGMRFDPKRGIVG